MRNSNLDIYMIIIVVILTCLSFIPIIALVREIKIADYPNYYRVLARKECHLIADVVMPDSCCLETVDLMAKNLWIAAGKKCPDGTIYSQPDCPGSIGLCIKPRNNQFIIE